VLREVFDALFQQRVVLEHGILKPSMVVPGKAQAQQAAPDEVAAQTLRVLRRCVPVAVASIDLL
jgi:fructose-bisphosphate aldolase, class I